MTQRQKDRKSREGECRYHVLASSGAEPSTRRVFTRRWRGCKRRAITTTGDGGFDLSCRGSRQPAERARGQHKAGKLKPSNIRLFHTDFTKTTWVIHFSQFVQSDNTDHSDMQSCHGTLRFLYPYNPPLQTRNHTRIGRVHLLQHTGESSAYTWSGVKGEGPTGK